MSNLDNIFLEENKMKERTILLKIYFVLNIAFNIDILFAGKPYIHSQQI
tara:strand:+ start:661 stop:807 length:147 start_codon:yes stop_codon:yes gene_type:complete